MRAPILLCVLLRNMAMRYGVPLLKMKDHLEERTKEPGKPAGTTSSNAPAGAGGR